MSYHWKNETRKISLEKLKLEIPVCWWHCSMGWPDKGGSNIFKAVVDLKQEVNNPGEQNPETHLFVTPPNILKQQLTGYCTSPASSPMGRDNKHGWYEDSLNKKEYCRCGPHPLQVISSRARPYLLRERATLAAFSRISGVGHSGSWPPLHCEDSTNLAPEAAPGAPLHSEALSPECGREHQGTGDGWANSTCRSRA